MKKTKTTTAPVVNTTITVSAPTTPLVIKATPAPKAAATPSKTKVTRIGKIAAAKLVLAKGKKFFNVTFMEKNKSKAKGAPALVERNMTCRLGVVKYTKAGIAAANAGTSIPATKGKVVAAKTSNDLKVLGMVGVYEMTGDKGYKTLNLATMTALKIAGGVYKVS